MSCFCFRSKQQDSKTLIRKSQTVAQILAHKPSALKWNQPQLHKAKHPPPLLNGRSNVCNQKHSVYIHHTVTAAWTKWDICSLLLALKGPPEDQSADIQPRCSSSSRRSLRKMLASVVLPSPLVTPGLSGHQLKVSRGKLMLEIHQRLHIRTCPTKRQKL